MLLPREGPHCHSVLGCATMTGPKCADRPNHKAGFKFLTPHPFQELWVPYY